MRLPHDHITEEEKKTCADCIISNYHQRIGATGGNATLKNKGREHFSRIGKMKKKPIDK